MNKSKLKQWLLVFTIGAVLGCCNSAFAWQSGSAGGLPSQPPSPSAGLASPFGSAQESDEFAPEQAFQVNERFAGWREAGNDDEELGDTLRANWVMAGPFGALAGRLAGIEGADAGNLVITLLNNGRVVTTTTPDDDASFTFPNVRQGAYSLVGWGDNAFFAFGFNVLRYSEDAPTDIPTELLVTAAPNRTSINLDWIRHFSPGVKFRVYGRYTQGEESEDLDRLYGFKGLSTNFPDAVPATSLSHQAVSYSDNGLLMGRIHQVTTLTGRPVDIRNTRVMLLRNDDVFAATTTDNYGVFGFTDIPQGEYACVAAGIDGMGCIGITVSNTPPPNAVGNLEPGADPVELEPNPIDFTLVPSETIGWLHHQATEAAYLRVVSRPRQPQMNPNQNQFNNIDPRSLLNQNERRGARFIRRLNDSFEGFFYNEPGRTNPLDDIFNTRNRSQFYNPRPGGYRPR